MAALSIPAAIIAASGVVLILAYRVLTMAVRIADETLIIRNPYRTYRVPRNAVAHVDAGKLLGAKSVAALTLDVASKRPIKLVASFSERADHRKRWIEWADSLADLAPTPRIRDYVGDDDWLRRR